MIQVTVYLLMVRSRSLQQVLSLTHRLCIDENLVVKKVGLFATVFQRFDGTESYYFNSQLFNKFMYAISESCSCSFDSYFWVLQYQHSTKRKHMGEPHHANIMDDTIGQTRRPRKTHQRLALDRGKSMV